MSSHAAIFIGLGLVIGLWIMVPSYFQDRDPTESQKVTVVSSLTLSFIGLIIAIVQEGVHR